MNKLKKTGVKKVAVKDSEPRKYKINECLLKHPVPEHRIAVQRIPGMLGISLNTFHNYRNILIDDVQDIPHEKVRMFEVLFELAPGELLNKVIHGKSLKEIVKKELFKKK